VDEVGNIRNILSQYVTVLFESVEILN